MECAAFLEQNVHFPFSLGFYVTLSFPSKRAISSQVGTGHLVQSDIMAEPSLRSLDPGSFADEPPWGALWSAGHLPERKLFTTLLPLHAG